MKNEYDNTASRKIQEQAHGFPDTTVIRVSNGNYERLREKAYFTRSTIRQIADEILEEQLKEQKK